MKLVKKLKVLTAVDGEEGGVEERNLEGLHIVGTSTRVDLARFFAASQRLKAPNAGKDNHLLPQTLSGLADEQELFLVVRNRRGCTGILPLGLGGSGTPFSAGLACQVTWFLNRRKKGTKTTTQLRLSDKTTAWVAIASDNRKKLHVYSIGSLLSKQHHLAVPAPFQAKGFRWKTLAVSASGNEVVAQCENLQTEQTSLWLWTQGLSQWSQVELGTEQQQQEQVPSTPQIAFPKEREELLLLTSSFKGEEEEEEEEEEGEERGGKERKVIKVTLSCLAIDFSSSDKLEKKSVSAEVSVPFEHEPTTRIQKLDDENGLHIATIISCRESFKMIVSKSTDLSTVGLVHTAPDILNEYENVNAVALNLIPETKVRDRPSVVVLFECGIFCLYDVGGNLLTVLESGVKTHPSLNPSVNHAQLKEEEYIITNIGQEICVVNMMDSTCEEGEEEEASAIELSNTRKSEQARGIYLDFLESLLLQSSYGQEFGALSDQLETVLSDLIAEQGSGSLILSLTKMVTILCEEEEYLAALWLLESSEELASTMKVPVEASSPIDWLSMWQVLANTVFESLGEEEDELNNEYYDRIASALWKRLISNGLDAMVESQFEAANDGVFLEQAGNSSNLAVMIVDADRAFIHGQLEQSLSLYKSAGPEGYMSYISCCLHAYKIEECLEAIYSMLHVSADIDRSVTWFEPRESLQMRKLEVCSEIGSFLLEMHKPSLNTPLQFPSPLSWSVEDNIHASDQRKQSSKKCRRLPLNKEELKVFVKDGPASRPSLALGFFVHGLKAESLHKIPDATLLWDDLGHWRHVVCLLRSISWVLEWYGKEESAVDFTEKANEFLKMKSIAKMGNTGFADKDFLIEVLSLLSAFLSQPESPGKYEAFEEILKVLRSSLATILKGNLLVGEVSSLNQLTEKCASLHETIGGLLSIFVLLSRPFVEYAGVSYDSQGKVKLSSSAKLDQYFFTSFSTMFEWLCQTFMTLRSYSLLASQWQNLQSSSILSEREEYAKELLLCLALILISDPDNLLQRSQDIQKIICWILQNFTSHKLFIDDPGLLCVLHNTIQKARMTGPTKSVFESISKDIGIQIDEMHLYTESAETYEEVLRSDSESCLQELFGLCCEALTCTNSKSALYQKQPEDDSVVVIQSFLAEMVEFFVGDDDMTHFNDPKWPCLADCIEHPLNCVNQMEIVCNEKILAHILNLDAFPSLQESVSEAESPSEKSEASVITEITVGNVIRVKFLFQGEDSSSFEDSFEESDPSQILLPININLHDSPSTSDSTMDPEDLLEESPASDSAEDITYRDQLLLDKFAKALVESAISNAIANATSELIQLKRREEQGHEVVLVEEQEEEEEAESSLEPVKQTDDVDEPIAEQSPPETSEEDNLVPEEAKEQEESESSLESVEQTDDVDEPIAEQAPSEASEEDNLVPEEAKEQEESESSLESVEQTDDVDEPIAEQAPSEASEDLVKALVPEEAKEQDEAESSLEPVKQSDDVDEPIAEQAPSEASEDDLVKALVPEEAKEQDEAESSLEPVKQTDDVDEPIAEQSPPDAFEDLVKALVESAISNAIANATSLQLIETEEQGHEVVLVEEQEAEEAESSLEPVKQTDDVDEPIAEQAPPETSEEDNLVPEEAKEQEESESSLEPVKQTDDVDEPIAEQSPPAASEDLVKALVESAISNAIAEVSSHHNADDRETNAVVESGKADPGPHLVETMLVEGGALKESDVEILPSKADSILIPPLPVPTKTKEGLGTLSEKSDKDSTDKNSTLNEDSEMLSEHSVKPESSSEIYEGYTQSDSGTSSKKYASLSDIRSSLEEVHFMTSRNQSKQDGTATQSKRAQASNREKRPWDQDLALFQNLGVKSTKLMLSQGVQADAEQAEEAMGIKKESRKESKKRRQRKSRAAKKAMNTDALSTTRKTKSRVATTQTELQENAAAKEKVRQTEAESSKEVILNELKRIKSEYLNAIKEAQQALTSCDPSINKVLESQAETLYDYDEVLEMAVSSAPRVTSEERESLPSNDRKDKVASTVESSTEEKSSEEKVSEKPKPGIEEEEVRQMRRRRAAKMLRRIVSNAKDRRRSKDKVEEVSKEEDARSSETPVSLKAETPPPDYRKDMPLKAQTESLLDQMEEAVQLSSQTLKEKTGDKIFDSGPEERESTALASPDELKDTQDLQAPTTSLQTPSDEGESTKIAALTRDLNSEKPTVDSTAKLIKQDAAPDDEYLLSLSGAQDPALVLFRHFFEIKSADPTSRLREKYRSSPQCRNGSIARGNFKPFLLQLLEFCGSDFSGGDLQYIQLLFDVVIFVTENIRSSESSLNWEIYEEKFVQISWHYYQATKGGKGKLEELLEDVSQLISEYPDDLSFDVAKDLASDVKAEIPLSKIAIAISRLFQRIKFEPRIREICLIYCEVMHSMLQLTKIDITDLIDFMHPKSARKVRLADLATEENVSALPGKMSVEQAETTQEANSIPDSPEKTEEQPETELEVEVAVASPKQENVLPGSPEKTEAEPEREMEVVVAPKQEAEAEESLETETEMVLETSPKQENIVCASPEKAEQQLPEAALEVAVDLAVEAPKEEISATLPDEPAQELVNRTQASKQEEIAVPASQKTTRDLGAVSRSTVELSATELKSKIESIERRSAKDTKVSPGIIEVEVSTTSFSDVSELSKGDETSGEDLLVDEKLLDVNSTLKKIKLEDIVSDIQEDEDNWLKISSDAASPGSMVSFFDVQSISISDFHRSSSPQSTLHDHQGPTPRPLAGVDPFQEKKNDAYALPPSNLELELLFAEMDDMEKSRKVETRKPKTIKKLEKDTKVALSKLKKKQNTRRERVKQELDLEQKRYEEAQKKAEKNVLKYAKLRQENYESILGDVQTALIEAEVAAYTLENENQELHTFLAEVESEQNKRHTEYISKLQDHLALVEAQIGRPGE